MLLQRSVTENWRNRHIMGGNYDPAKQPVSGIKLP